MKSWLYDHVVDLDVIEGEDGEWERRFLDSRLFAVDPEDAAAIEASYVEWPEKLPPLPFPNCWFEATSDAAREALFFVAPGQTVKRDCLAVHIEDQGDDIWSVLFILRDVADRTFDVLNVMVVPGQVLTTDGKQTDSNAWRAPCILAELATAQGVYHEEQPAYRQLRRRYERRGLTSPPRAILHIGHPRHGPSVPRGESREWSCRWWVRGHYRRLNSEKLTWVRAYVKGPEGKPWRKPPPRYLLHRTT